MAIVQPQQRLLHKFEKLIIIFISNIIIIVE